MHRPRIQFCPGRRLCRRGAAARRQGYDLVEAGRSETQATEECVTTSAPTSPPSQPKLRVRSVDSKPESQPWKAFTCEGSVRQPGPRSWEDAGISLALVYCRGDSSASPESDG